jgi:hypothetical protein
MVKVSLKFTSQVYRGVTAVHDAEIWLPESGVDSKQGGIAAIILGKADAADAEHDWVEHVVLGLGVPCMVVRQAFKAAQFGAKNPGHLMSMGSRTFVKTGDVREYGYYALARIVSAAATVAEHLPEVKAKRFVVSGSSKGGMAVLIACAGDSRIVGCYPTAWNSGNLYAYTLLKGERWGWGMKPKETGPAGDAAGKTMALLESVRGQEIVRLFDPNSWGDLLQDKFVMPAVGTNDRLFHVLSDQHYFDGLKGRKAFLRLPNEGHGRKAPLHAKGWRFAVAAGLLGRPIPSVRIRSEERGDAIAVYAAVQMGGKPGELTLWTTQDASGDYRKAKWMASKQVVISKSDESIHLADLPKPESGVTAFFVLLEEQEGVGHAVISSNIVEVGKPVRYERPSKIAQKGPE